MPPRKIILPLLVLAVTAVLGYQFAVRRSGAHSDVVRVSGNIEVVDVELGFKIPGRVIERTVDEGEPVAKGQLVARLEDADLKADLAARRADRAAAAAVLAELQAGSRIEEIGAAKEAREKAAAWVAELEAGSRPQEIAVAQAAVASAEADEARARSEFARAVSLYQTKTISTEEYDRQRTAFDVATARLREARERLALVREGPRKEQIDHGKAALAQAEWQYKLVKAGPRKEQIDQAAAKLAQSAAGVELAETKLGYATLTSPMDGIVLSKNIEPGEYVAPGTPVVTVGDMVNVWLRAYITADDFRRVKMGQRARVTTDDGGHFEGRVSFIADEAEFTPKNVQTPKERTKLVYRIKIDIKNPKQELKRGMPADAEIDVTGEPTQQP